MPKSNFENDLNELNSIVAEMEKSTTGLEESLALYEKGIGILRRCYGTLQSTERKIVELIGIDDDGNILSKPFGHTSTLKKQEGK